MMNRVWFHPYQTLSEIRNHLFLSGARRALGQRSPSSGSPQLRLHGPDSCPGVNKPLAGCAANSKRSAAVDRWRIANVNRLLCESANFRSGSNRAVGAAT